MNFRTLSLGLALAALAAAASGQQTVMTGLANPRSLRFGPDGTLYVAEAGAGGGASGPSFVLGGGTESYGTTGGVSTWNGPGTQTRLISNLPSLADPTTGSEATGVADLAFTPSGGLALLFGLGGSPTDRAAMPTAGSVFGTLSAYGAGGFTTIQDYAARETADPDGNKEINSNPFQVVRDAAGYHVADGGANVLWSDGGYTVFPPQLEPNPFNPGSVPQESVPTSVIARNGGGYLVGSLGGFPFTQGESRIFTVGANGALLGQSKYGLTSIIDLAYAPDGSLLVEEISSTGLLNVGPGDIRRIAPNGAVDTIISGLITPTSMAFGSDGFLYVTNNGLSGTGGTVVRYAYSPVPEPTTLAAAGLGVLALLRRRRREPFS